ncbi:hypothetical protein [Collimonas humicola]|uniref:hypothetical protein n=1 Tax=Collimonas humicola TaxID=2825886 RepID=UPI001B8B5664|nr:hypothetical protein [Collimonas humicola]
MSHSQIAPVKSSIERLPAVMARTGRSRPSIYLDRGGVDAAGEAACRAKQFVEHRSMIADFRVKTATDDDSYPLFT